MLNTVAVATGYLHAHQPHSPALAARAAVHGYTTAYWWCAATYALGVLMAALLFRRHRTN